eukprot:COSAG06_NODE_334_length_17329_cov_5.387290_2_plen_85_part_00
MCGGEPEETSATHAAADRYLAAAFAYQFVQAAEVDLPVEGSTRCVRGDRETGRERSQKDPCVIQPTDERNPFGRAQGGNSGSGE